MKRFVTLGLILIPSLAFSNAMYLTTENQLPADEMRSLGLNVGPAEIEKMSTSVVGRLTYPSGGCTITFVSREGLTGTNWHCGDPCIQAAQAASLKENGKDHPDSQMEETGYIAESNEKEFKCSGYEMWVPTEISNVSSEFADLEKDRQTDPKVWSEKVRLRRETMRETCRNGQEDVICDVVRMNAGTEPYLEYKYRRFKDIRMVWTPPHALGEFGGQTDNWEFPRHTADFSFLRVYENGVPFQPANFAPVSSRGVRVGEPSFILGYPGATQRNISSYAAQFMADVQLPMTGNVYDVLMKTIESLYPLPQKGPYGNPWFYMANYKENSFRKAGLINTQRVPANHASEEANFKDSSALRRLSDIYSGARTYYPRYHFLNFMTARSFPIKSITAGVYAWNWATQPEDDKLREDERFKSWNKPTVQNIIANAGNFGTIEGDQKILAAYFQAADTAGARIHTFEKLKARAGTSGNGTVYDRMAQMVYSNTMMVAKTDKKEDRDWAKAARLAYFQGTPDTLRATQDSLLSFAIEVASEFKEFKADPKGAQPYAYEMERVNYENNVQLGRMYPDANSTVRFTLSTVQKDYRPIDSKKAYPYSTTLKSMARKDHFAKEGTADYELFLVPDFIKKAAAKPSAFKGQWYYANDLNDVPVNFVTQHIITGGSSGSSVFNKDGEVVGFAFDGTPESILDDVQLHPASRTIIVDMRYIGFLAENGFPKAKRVLRELGLPTAVSANVR